MELSSEETSWQKVCSAAKCLALGPAEQLLKERSRTFFQRRFLKNFGGPLP